MSTTPRMALNALSTTCTRTLRPSLSSRTGQFLQSTLRAQHHTVATRKTLSPSFRPYTLPVQQTKTPRSAFSTTTPARHGHLTPPKPGEERHVIFELKDGTRVDIECADGDNLLDIAQANDIEMEGACGGSCACSTCHVIVAEETMFDKMEEPSDDENDMLDLAFGLTETSRLGCQVVMSKELDGLVVKLPSMTRNLQASDFS